MKNWVEHGLASKVWDVISPNLPSLSMPLYRLAPIQPRNIGSTLRQLWSGERCTYQARLLPENLVLLDPIGSLKSRLNIFIIYNIAEVLEPSYPWSHVNCNLPRTFLGIFMDVKEIAWRLPGCYNHTAVFWIPKGVIDNQLITSVKPHTIDHGNSAQGSQYRSIWD